MRTMRRSLLRSLLSLSLAGVLQACVSSGAATRTPSPGQAVASVAATTTVTLAHINDVYEIGALDSGRSGGLARVATAFAALRQSATPVITTLGGDFLSPSALGTARVDGTPLAGRQMVDVLNATGLQFATLGNHEFDVAEAAFRARLEEARFQVIVSNVTDAQGQPFPKTTPGVMVPVTVHGRALRIGLTGVVTDANPRPWVRYRPAVESVRQAVTALPRPLDAVVVISHLTLEEDAALVEALPEIDLIVGGHEHENWLLRRGARLTPIVKADANARSLAVVSMTFGAEGTRPVVESRLLPLDERVQPDRTVARRVEQWTATAYNAFRRDGFTPEAAVVTLPISLDGRESVVRNRTGQLTDLIVAGMVRETGAAIGLLNGGSVRIDDVIPPGPLTEYDVIRVMPFGGKIVRVQMSGALLQRVLEAGRRNAGEGGYLHHSAAVTSTSTGWQVNGTPLAPEMSYAVSLPEFLLTGREANMAFLTRTADGVTGVEEFRDIRRAFIEELRRTWP
ncbi:MAG: bifunctional metallophosphatase/5'-nucleotidase [Acidobacteria bacterium]|nr:bifunctional metallophosphatase/5'-nucleotidase [Acidobacteriota bacterium]